MKEKLFQMTHFEYAEAFAGEELKKYLGKGVEVLFPRKSNLKGIDFVLYLENSNRYVSVQVKTSKWHPSTANKDRKKYGGIVFLGHIEVDKSPADLYCLVFFVPVSKCFGKGCCIHKTMVFTKPEMKKFMEKCKDKFAFGLTPDAEQIDLIRPLDKKNENYAEFLISNPKNKKKILEYINKRRK